MKGQGVYYKHSREPKGCPVCGSSGKGSECATVMDSSLYIRLSELEENARKSGKTFQLPGLTFCRTHRSDNQELRAKGWIFKGATSSDGPPSGKWLPKKNGATVAGEWTPGYKPRSKGGNGFGAPVDELADIEAYNEKFLSDLVPTELRDRGYRALVRQWGLDAAGEQLLRDRGCDDQIVQWAKDFGFMRMPSEASVNFTYQIPGVSKDGRSWKTFTRKDPVGIPAISADGEICGYQLMDGGGDSKYVWLSSSSPTTKKKGVGTVINEFQCKVNLPETGKLPLLVWESPVRWGKLATGTTASDGMGDVEASPIQEIWITEGALKSFLTAANLWRMGRHEIVVVGAGGNTYDPTQLASIIHHYRPSNVVVCPDAGALQEHTSKGQDYQVPVALWNVLTNLQRIQVGGFAVASSDSRTEPTTNDTTKSNEKLSEWFPGFADPNKCDYDIEKELWGDRKYLRQSGMSRNPVAFAISVKWWGQALKDRGWLDIDEMLAENISPLRLKPGYEFIHRSSRYRITAVDNKGRASDGFQVQVVKVNAKGQVISGAFAMTYNAAAMPVTNQWYRISDITPGQYFQMLPTSIKKRLDGANIQYYQGLQTLDIPAPMQPSLKKIKPDVKYSPERRGSVWAGLASSPSGRKRFVLDSSGVGTGKSYTAGAMDLDDWNSGGDEGNSNGGYVGQVIYLTNDPLNVTTPTLKDKKWAVLRGRDDGRVAVTVKGSEGETVQIRRAKRDSKELTLMPNCSRTRLQNLLIAKNVSPNAATVCNGCPKKQRCALGSGDGFGFIHDRSEALRSPYLIAHPMSVADIVADLDGRQSTEGGIVVVADEASQLEWFQPQFISMDEIGRTLRKMRQIIEDDKFGRYLGIRTSVTRLIQTIERMIDQRRAFGWQHAALRELFEKAAESVGGVPEIPVPVLESLNAQDLGILQEEADRVEEYDGIRELEGMFGNEDKLIEELEATLISRWVADFYVAMRGMDDNTLRVSMDATGVTIRRINQSLKDLFNSPRVVLSLLLDATEAPEFFEDVLGQHREYPIHFTEDGELIEPTREQIGGFWHIEAGIDENEPGESEGKSTVAKPIGDFAMGGNREKKLLNQWSKKGKGSRTSGASARKKNLASQINSTEQADARSVHQNYQGQAEVIPNVRIVQITGMGLMGARRTKYKQDRTKKVIAALAEQAGIEVTDLPVIDGKKFAAEGAGYWFKDSRGSNAYQTATHLVLAGLPCPNLTTMLDEYALLKGRDPGTGTIKRSYPVYHIGEAPGQYTQVILNEHADEEAARFIRERIITAYRQAIGRVRYNRRPSEEIVVYIITEYPLPWLVELIDVRQLLGESTAEQRVSNVLTTWVKRNGFEKKLTITALAKKAGCAISYVSKLEVWKAYRARDSEHFSNFTRSINNNTGGEISEKLQSQAPQGIQGSQKKAPKAGRCDLSFPQGIPPTTPPDPDDPPKTADRLLDIRSLVV